MTSVFLWNESFVTHLPSVDKQHQRLVALINDLGETVLSSGALDLKSFTAARETLLDYVMVHFGDEESQMEKASLDRRHIETHRAEHRAFVSDIPIFFESEYPISLESAGALVDYLVNWLAYHILHVDQCMARQLHLIKKGLTPEQAFEDECCNSRSHTEPLLAALRILFQTVSMRNRELRMLNSELEQRVVARTLELEQANQRLESLSTTDELTGLPNRRFFALTLERLWNESRRYGSPLSLLMLDADHFKEVNDRFGHAEGDTLLRALAARIRKVVRISDIVCRIGGDEFVVLCPQTSYAGAYEIGRKILASRQAFLTSDGVECWNGSISIGVAEAGESLQQPEGLLKEADKALYDAKHFGGGRVEGTCHSENRQ